MSNKLKNSNTKTERYVDIQISLQVYISARKNALRMGIYRQDTIFKGWS